MQKPGNLSQTVIRRNRNPISFPTSKRERANSILLGALKGLKGSGCGVGSDRLCSCVSFFFFPLETHSLDHR